MAESNQSIEKGAYEPKPGPSVADSVRVLSVGLNLLVVAVALPLSFSEPRLWAAFLWLLLPLLVLLAGVISLKNYPRASTWILLYVFPVAVGALVAAAPSFAREPVYSAPLGLLSATCLLFYIMVTTQVTSRPRALIEATQQALAAESAENLAPLVGQRVFILGITVGAVVVAFVAPLLAPAYAFGPEFSWEERWGDQAEAAQILSLTAAGTLGVTMMGLFLAPALRKPRRERWTREDRRRRALGFAVPALMGFAFFVVYELFV